MVMKPKRNFASAHARETTTSTPPFSSRVAAWVDQLPSPPQVAVHSTDGTPLVELILLEPAISKSSTIKKQGEPQSHPHTTLDTNQRSSQYQRAEEEMEALSNGHAMATRGRPSPAEAVLQPQVTSPQLKGAPIPRLHPSASSGNSASTAQSSSRSPTKSRSRSPTKTNTSHGSRVIGKKEQLAFMEPGVFFDDIQEIRDPSVPKSVSNFWKDYIMLAKDEQKVVPEELKSKLKDQLDTPMKTKMQIPESSYSPNLYGAQDVMNIHALVDGIVKRAASHRKKIHEPQWVSTVVGPLIAVLETLPSMMPVLSTRSIESLNIVSIQPRELCPSSPDEVFALADKKIDHALAIELARDELRRLQTGGSKYRVGGEPSINQTYACAFKFMFVNFEVKVDDRDPLIQLGIWIASELEKRFREGYPMDVPIPAVAIYGDDWHLWIAYATKVPAKQRRKDGKAYQVQFLGPIIMGNTYGHAAVYKIFHVLKAVIQWGLEVYQRDYVEKVVARYKKK
ncbi:MAG: hypothetical protein Q9211_003134 [Gyalolechia sp. 1 TL-2023]